MRILIVTDAWRPQTNGVVSTLAHTVECLRGFGHEVALITPEGFRTIPCPSYPEIRLAVLPGAKVRRLIEAFGPRRAFWGTDLSAMLSRTTCTYRQAVTMFTEEMKFLSADDLEWIMGRGLAECLAWPAK